MRKSVVLIAATLAAVAAVAPPAQAAPTPNRSESSYHFVVSGDGFRKDTFLNLQCFRLPNGKYRRQPVLAVIQQVSRTFSPDRVDWVVSFSDGTTKTLLEVGVKDRVFDVASSDTWPDRQVSDAAWHSHVWDSSSNCTRTIRVTNRQWWKIGFKQDSRLPGSIS